MGLAWCSFSKYDINAGSILDRVISQASNEDDCLLYRLANYKKGGEIIDAYNTGGQAEVEKFIREQFSVFMYNDGKGQIINRSEYLRWRFRNQHQVIRSTYLTRLFISTENYFVINQIIRLFYLSKLA